MKHTRQLNWKIPGSLAVAALLIVVSSAPAALVMTGAYQQSATSFTPTWTVAPSLIAGAPPTTQSGNFTSEGNTPGVSALTDGTLGIVSSTIYTNYAAGGSSAGTSVTYALPAQVNGYNLTNITVYSGWGNGGRVGQAFTVLYSTVANPGNFIWLTNVSYSAGFTGNLPNNPIAFQVQLSDSAGGAIAANVAAIQFDFTCPTADDENGGSGYSEITVQGTPAGSVVSPVISLTTSNEDGSNPFTPTWTAETPDLIAGLTPTIANGSFINEDCVNGASVLTDGAVGTSGDENGFASCGAGGGTTLVYTLTNSPLNGSDVTNIVVYTGWANNGRFGQYYTISYSTVSAQSTYIPITTVFYLPENATGTPANRVAISTSTGVALAKNVYNLKFDFASPPGASSFNNAWQGYSEIVVQGTNSNPPTVGRSPIVVQDTTPSSAETVIGDMVIFTASYTNTPPPALQWQKIISGPAATNNINVGVVTATNNGVITSTLTLNNVQISDSGIYTLKATNSADGTAAPTYSTAATLIVSNAPTASDNINVIVKYAGQTYSGSTTYFPWIVDTSNDLLLGAQQGSGPGTFSASAGDFSGGGSCNGDPTLLSDGVVGPFPSTPSRLFVAGGVVDYGTGYFMTYSLDTSSAPKGFDLTNITVFGGWPNADHNEQSYQILYATVSAPMVFVPLASVAYNPTDANGMPTVTRTELIPATSAAMVHNVVAVEISWASPRPINGWDAYSEVLIKGVPSTGVWPAETQDVNPQTAKDVVGSQIVVSAAFSGATSLQWQLNGTDVTGATASTLTLNNLQLTNTGIYTLVASNSVGAVASRSCVVTVNPVPAQANNAIISIAEQTASASVAFAPTWDASALPSSLIANVFPSSYGFGSFTTPDGNHENAAGPGVLADGQIGTIDFGITSVNAMETCMGADTGAGNYVIYPLTGSANGYDITNITTYGGWSNSGRDSQAYSIYYANAASPTNFIYLNSVSNSPANQSGAIWTRATIAPVTGTLASNVVALMFDMRSPIGVSGYEGYSELSVFGSPSENPDLSPVVITVANENTDAPDWVVETNSLIENQRPSSVGPGAFSGGISGGSTSEGLSALTDGTYGPSTSVSGLGNTNFATAGGASGAGSSVTYTCTNGSWNITNIVVYSGWSDYNRGGQFYNITYSTLSARTTFVPLVSVNYDPLALLSPNIPTGSSANRVAITPAHSVTLATNVYAVTFDFTPQKAYLDNGFSGYAEIVLQGTNQPSEISPTAPTIASPHYVNGNLIVTGIGGTPGAGYTWLVTTNLSVPIIWTTNSTGTLDGFGVFSNSIPVNSSLRDSFFRLRLP